MKNFINEKTKRQMIAVVVIGVILIIVDMASTLVNTGVEIIKTEKGLYLVRPDEGEKNGRIVLEAQVKCGNEEFNKRYNLSIEPYSSLKEETEDAPEKAISQREVAECEMRSVMGALNSDLSSKRIELPTKLKSGEKISWYRRKQTNTLMLCLLTLGALVAVWRSKGTAQKKEQEQRKNSVMRQLPEFVNRLVLLLNAGLVLNTAFEKTVEESVRYCGDDKDYFYSNMSDIYESVKHANGSMSKGLRNFAKESGIKELMRVSNIISDNINKGVELNKKLERESELLWIMRKKNCEERGKMAETKLTLPLMLFLMVLIIITVAPALIEL
ncbi:MAG: hypothetical protein Q4C80_00140 [Bacillota bacterium]|nr:hypothetical protein [Bacillota bacterium]